MAGKRRKKEAELKALWVSGGGRYPSMQTQRAFQQLWQSGVFQQVRVVSSPSHFSIQADLFGGGSVVLATTRGDSRVFLNPGAALLWLKKLGVKQALVDIADWDVDLAGLTMRLRPDVTARRLKRERFERENGCTPLSADLAAVDRKEERRRLIDYQRTGRWTKDEMPSDQELEEARKYLDGIALQNLLRQQEEEDRKRRAKVDGGSGG